MKNFMHSTGATPDRAPLSRFSLTSVSPAAYVAHMPAKLQKDLAAREPETSC